MTNGEEISLLGIFCATTLGALHLYFNKFSGTATKAAKAAAIRVTGVSAKARGVSVYSIECLRRLDAQCALPVNKKDATHAEFAERARRLIKGQTRRELHLLKHAISSASAVAVSSNAAITATKDALMFSADGGKRYRELPMDKHEGKLTVGLFVLGELAVSVSDDACSMSVTTAGRLLTVFETVGWSEQFVPLDKWSDDLMP